VSANMPDEKASVLRMLEKKHATSRNLLFASNDTAALQEAFDPTWESAVPYTVLLDADGKVLYKNLGSVDILELRRTILANLPSDYIGFRSSGGTAASMIEADIIRGEVGQNCSAAIQGYPRCPIFVENFTVRIQQNGVRNRRLPCRIKRLL